MPTAAFAKAAVPPTSCASKAALKTSLTNGRTCEPPGRLAATPIRSARRPLRPASRAASRGQERTRSPRVPQAEHHGHGGGRVQSVRRLRLRRAQRMCGRHRSSSTAWGARRTGLPRGLSTSRRPAPRPATPTSRRRTSSRRRQAGAARRRLRSRRRPAPRVHGRANGLLQVTLTLAQSSARTRENSCETARSVISAKERTAPSSPRSPQRVRARSRSTRCSRPLAFAPRGTCAGAAARDEDRDVVPGVEVLALPVQLVGDERRRGGAARPVVSLETPRCPPSGDARTR